MSPRWLESRRLARRIVRLHAITTETRVPESHRLARWIVRVLALVAQNRTIRGTSPRDFVGSWSSRWYRAAERSAGQAGGIHRGKMLTEVVIDEQRLGSLFTADRLSTCPTSTPCFDGRESVCLPPWAVSESAGGSWLPHGFRHGPRIKTSAGMRRCAVRVLQNTMLFLDRF